MRTTIILILCLAPFVSARANITAVFRNADFRISDPAKRGADWLSVENGRVAEYGRGIVPSNLRTRVQIDLKGRIVMPALTDAHAHLADLGAERDQVNLRGAKSENEAVERVRVWMQANPGTGPVYGSGWDQSDWPGGQYPTRATLDLVSSNRPIILYRVDGHAAWVNKVALEKSALWFSALAPKGGEIRRGSDNRPNGILIDAAMGALDKLSEAVTVETLKRHYLLAVEDALSQGITSVHEAGANAAQIAAIRELLSEKKVRFRFYEMLSAKSSTELEYGLARGPVVGEFDGQLNVRTVKLFLDGAMGSGGAAFDESYSDDTANSGLLQMSMLELRALITKVHTRGFQVAIHAIGSRANREALDAIEGGLGALSKAARPRLEHAQVLIATDFARAARLGVIASMQPTHCTSDMKWVEKRIGPTRARYAYAWKSFLDAGVPLAFGSDAPVESINPWQGLYSAITRQSPEGQPPKGFFPEERLSFAEAWNAFTKGAAYAGFQEGDLGTLENGRYADFVVLGDDPVQAKPRSLYDFKVEATYVAGNKVYERKSPTP